MIVTKTSDEGLRNRRTHATYSNVVVRDYFREPERTGWPHAYLVEQAANTTIRPHFHVVDQFQVIVHGGGELGRDKVEPVTVHYADAYTGYGPINSGADGLFYFTLRTKFDLGLHGLPESREEQRRGRPGRPRHRVGAIADFNAGTTQRTNEVAVDPVAVLPVAVVPAESDGLSATFLRIAANTLTSAPDPAVGSGQYILVLSGGVTVRRQSLGTWSCIFSTSDEPPPEIVGGPDGAGILVMQFPRVHEQTAG